MSNETSSLCPFTFAVIMPPPDCPSISISFKKADIVVLCPIYKAGENISLGFDYSNFAREIIKNSNVKLILIKNNLDLLKFTKQNIYGDKIVVGMGAGSISNWMRELPKLLK